MKRILTPIQKKFLRAFQKSELSRHFYWTGGTLLASHYLYHRFSEDLDFFSDELFFDEYMAAQFLGLKKATGAKKISETKRLNRQQLIFEYGRQSLKVEFVYFPFPALAKRILLPEFKIAVDSLKDLAANKLHACFERSEPKDIFDLYQIIKKKRYVFMKLFPLVEKKFGVSFDPVTTVSKILKNIPTLQNLRPLVLNKNLLHLDAIKKFFEEEGLAFLKEKIR